MQSEEHVVTSNHLLVASLYQCYAPALLLYICRQVPTREDAEDVLLEVFQAALESDILTTVEESKRRAWLWTVASHKAIDHYRRAQYRPVFSAGLEELENVLFDDDFFTPESFTLRQEAYAELRALISTLPELQQEVLRLRFAHGLKCGEIAQRLHKSNTAIRAMLSRSLNLLRNSYKQRREDKSNGQK